MPSTIIPTTTPLDKALSLGIRLGDDDRFKIDNTKVDVVKRVIKVGVTKAKDVKDDRLVMLK